MKTIWKIGILGSLVIAALAFTGFAYASSKGAGMRELLSGNFGNQGIGMMNGGEAWGMQHGEGFMDEYMVEAWAQVLGLSVEEIQEKLDQGLTHYDIALELGRSQEDFGDLMQTAMTIAVASAVEDGALTGEQAQFMVQRMGRMRQPFGGPGQGVRDFMFQRMNRSGQDCEDCELNRQPFMHGERGSFGPMGEPFAAVEEFLGLSREEIQSRIGNGETLEQIITSEGRTLEEWVAFSMDAVAARLSEAVADGEMTQEQADAMLLRHQERFENGWGEPFGPQGPFGEPAEYGPGMMGPGRHGGGEHGPKR